MDQQRMNAFKDPTNLTRWTRIFLYILIVIQLVGMISGFMQYQLLEGFRTGAYPQSDIHRLAKSNDTRQAIVGLTQMAVLIITAIFFLKFIYRANYNARQLGATNMRFSPGWSVGWYFIPIANLWKPYQAMSEIWRASKNPQNPEAESVPSLLPLWWFAWIVSNILGRASFKLAFAKDISSLITGSIVSIISDAFEIPVCFIGLALIGGIYQMQMSHFRGGSEVSAPVTPDAIAPS